MKLKDFRVALFLQRLHCFGAGRGFRGRERARRLRLLRRMRVFVHCSCEIAVVMSGAGCAEASRALPWQCLRRALHCACHGSRAHTDCCGPASCHALRASLAMMLLSSSKAVLTDSASMKSQRDKGLRQRKGCCHCGFCVLFFCVFFFPPSFFRPPKCWLIICPKGIRVNIMACKTLSFC